MKQFLFIILFIIALIVAWEVVLTFKFEAVIALIIGTIIYHYVQKRPS
jgi:uncharacterized membrane protein